MTCTRAPSRPTFCRYRPGRFHRPTKRADSLAAGEIERTRAARSSPAPDPERDQDRSARELAHHVVRNRPRGFGADLAAAAGTKGARDARHQEFQVVVDLRHRADGRTRALHRVRLLDRDRRRDAADFVDARLVHAVEELPHVWTERFDVTALAFRVDRVEGETRFAAAARPGDDGQLSERQIEIDPLQVVLARAANLDATRLGESGSAVTDGFSAVFEPTGDYPVERSSSQIFGVNRHSSRVAQTHSPVAVALWAT